LTIPGPLAGPGPAGGEKIGVLLCGHGSRDAGAVAEFAQLARALPERLPAGWMVEHGYLEFANPVLRDGLEALKARGAERILAVPGMLFAAMHAKNDIPSVLTAWSERSGVPVAYGRELGVDPKMVAAGAARVREAISRADREAGAVALHDTCLVVIGRGASDPDANANVSKVARLLWEGLGLGWCEVGYSGVTFPLVEPCLEHVARLGYRRVVVLPWFLFTGVLVDRIRGFSRRVAERHPGTQWVDAGYLGLHAEVLRTFAERATEQVEGVPPPNCQMCKYRTQVLGFEGEVGSPQESHHHHVEGQGASAPGANVADCALCDDFCTGLCRLKVVAEPLGFLAGGGVHRHADGTFHSHGDHGHGHAHPRYPHEDHPLGPLSALATLKTR
jgi:sirohydrochlorin cobaltochelatase